MNAAISITGNLSTNIALYNPPGSGQEFTQTLTCVIVNRGDQEAKFEIDVQGDGGNAGSVDLRQGGSSPTKQLTTELLPIGGTCNIITVIPTKNSTQPYDVILKAVKAILKDNTVVDLNSKDIQDKMTVVKVLFPTKIYNPNTPKEMLSLGAYRIPPGTFNPTPFSIAITPNLRTANPAQFVTLQRNGDDNAGTIAFDGQATRRYTSSTQISLTGTTSTRPLRTASFPLDHPTSAVRKGPLHIQLVVGRTPTIESIGFSVAAIPDRIIVGNVTADDPNHGVGFGVTMIVHSDSGSPGDLDQVGVGELVVDRLKKGGYLFTVPFNSNDVYAGPASNHPYNDQHDTTFLTILNPIARTAAGDFGEAQTKQIYQFLDFRTGVVGIPVTNSGFIINKSYVITGSTVVANHTKEGADVTVLGKHALPGFANAYLLQEHVAIPANPGRGPIPSSGPIVPPVTFVMPASDPATTRFVTGSPSLLGPGSFNKLQFAFIGFEQTGTAFNVVVNANNLLGIDNTFNGPITLALNNPGNSTLNGTLTVNAVNGVATFTGLTLTNPSASFSLSFKASATDYSDIISTTYQIANNRIVDRPVTLTRPPFNVAAGEQFSYAVQIVKGTGNVDTNFNGLVSLQLSQFIVNQFEGVTTVHAVNGVATFTGLSILDPGSVSYEMRIVGQNAVYIDGLVSTTVSTAATKLVVTGPPPSQVTRNGAFTVEISAENAYGVLDKKFTGNVTLSLAGGPASATLGGTLTVPVINGVATFAGLSIDSLGNGYTITASADGLTSAVTQALSVKQLGIGTRLVFTTPPASTIGSGVPFSVAVSVEDDLGTVDANFSGVVTLTLNNYATTDPSALAGARSVPVVNGKATFNGLSLQYNGSYSLTATSTNLSTATSDLFLISKAPADHLVLTPTGRFLTDGTLRNGFEIQVVAANSMGEIDTTFASPISLNLLQGPAGSQFSFVPVSLVGGVAQVQVQVNTVGSGYVFQVNGGGLSGMSPVVTVTSDELLVSTQPPTQVTAGTPFGLVVIARNVAGDVDTSFQGLVTVSDLYGAALGGTTSIQAVNGVATFTDIRSQQANPATALVVSSPGTSPASTRAFFVAPASASTLALTAQPPVTLTAGQTFDLQVFAKDASGNVDTIFNSPVTITLTNNSTGAVLQGVTTVTSMDGVIAFSGLSVDKAGAGYTLTIASPGLSSAISTAFTVKAAGVATHLVMTTPPPANLTAGAAFSLIVKAEDGLSSVDTTFTGTVKLTDANGNTLASVAAVNGLATFTNLHLNQAGGTFVQASSTGLVLATSDPINVNAGVATKLFAFAPAPTIVTSASFGVEVSALDTQGNLDTSYTGMVTLALGNAAGAVLGGTKTIAAVHGVATFENLNIDKAGTGYTLQATASGLTASTTTTFAAVVNQLVLTSTLPTPVLPGVSFDVTVAAHNNVGATDAAFTGPVKVHVIRVTEEEATEVGLFTATAANGVATFSGLSIAQAGTYLLAFESDGVVSAVTDTFLVGSAAPPVTSVLALPSLSRPSFTVSWSGTDEGGPGIANYDVFVSDNGGAFTAFLTGTTLTSSQFTGVAGHTYGFYVVAIDTNGNREEAPAAAQATTRALLDSANKIYVFTVYQDVLGRSPDVNGLTYWSGQIDAGTPRGVLVDLIDHSDEYFATVIRPAYQQFLGRAADGDGLAYWTKRMHDGLTDEQLEAGFIGSAEFYQHSGGTDKSWVDAMYVSLLGRGPDASGEAFWIGQLAQGANRANVALGFATSEEREKQHISANYQKYLGRLPDDGGLAYWLDQFSHHSRTNEDLITGFVASDEYFAKHST